MRLRIRQVTAALLALCLLVSSVEIALAGTPELRTADSEPVDLLERIATDAPASEDEGDEHDCACLCACGCANAQLVTLAADRTPLTPSAPAPKFERVLPSLLTFEPDPFRPPPR